MPYFVLAQSKKLAQLVSEGLSAADVNNDFTFVPRTIGQMRRSDAIDGLVFPYDADKLDSVTHLRTVMITLDEFHNQSASATPSILVKIIRRKRPRNDREATKIYADRLSRSSDVDMIAVMLCGGRFEAALGLLSEQTSKQNRSRRFAGFQPRESKDINSATRSRMPVRFCRIDGKDGVEFERLDEESIAQLEEDSPAVKEYSRGCCGWWFVK